MQGKTNFDRYPERKLEDADFRKRFEAEDFVRIAREGDAADQDMGIDKDPKPRRGFHARRLHRRAASMQTPYTFSTESGTGYSAKVSGEGKDGD
jgi:hypothetical protein